MLWLQAAVKTFDFKIKAIAGTRYPADLGTKPLTRAKIIELLQVLGTTLTTLMVQRARSSTPTSLPLSAVLRLTLPALSQMQAAGSKFVQVNGKAWNVVYLIGVMIASLFVMIVFVFFSSQASSGTCKDQSLERSSLGRRYER